MLAKRRPRRREVRYVPGLGLGGGHSDHLEPRSLAAPILLRTTAFLGVKAWTGQLEPTAWVSTPMVAQQIASTTVQSQNPFTGATATAQGYADTLISDGSAASSGSPSMGVSTTHDHQEALQGNWSMMPNVTTIETHARGSAQYAIVDQGTGLPTTYNAYGQFHVVFAPSPEPVDETIKLYFTAPGVYAAINSPPDPYSTNNLHLIYQTPSGPVDQIYPNFARAGGDVLITYSYTSGVSPVNVTYASMMKTVSHTPPAPGYTGYVSQELFWYSYSLQFTP